MLCYAKSLQLCLTLCDPIDGSPPGSAVPGILQARILEWVAISFSRGSSRPRDWTQVSRIAGRLFTVWATGEYFSEYDTILFVFHFFNFIRLSENVQSYFRDFLTWQFYISNQFCFVFKFLILDLSPFIKREDMIPFIFAIGSTPEYILELY